MQNPGKDRFISVGEGCGRAGIDKATGYRNAGKNGFPKIYEITPHRSGFRESEFDQWMLSRPLAQQKPQLTARLQEGRAKAKAASQKGPLPQDTAPRKRRKALGRAA